MSLICSFRLQSDKFFARFPCFISSFWVNFQILLPPAATLLPPLFAHKQGFSENLWQCGSRKQKLSTVQVEKTFRSILSGKFFRLYLFSDSDLVFLISDIGCTTVLIAIHLIFTASQQVRARF